MTDVSTKKTPKLKLLRQPPDKTSSQNADVMEHFKKRLIHQLEKVPEKIRVEQSTEKSETTKISDENSKSTYKTDKKNGILENNSSVGPHGSTSESELLNWASRPGLLDNTPENGNSSDKSESRLYGTKGNAEADGTNSESSTISETLVKKKEESETYSFSGSPSAASMDKKKEVIQKIARKKAVSRSQFRHNNILMFKLGSSKYTLVNKSVQIFYLHISHH